MAKRKTQRHIPVIDLQSGDTRAQVKEFGDALATYGFAIVRNHGVPKAALDAAYAASAETFDLDEAVKLGYADATDGHHTGYCPFKKEKAVGAQLGDLKEFWHYRRIFKPGQGRTPTEVPSFIPAVDQLYGRLEAVGMRLLGLLDDYLGQPHGTLPGMARGGDTLLRLLHYPAFRGRPKAMRAAQHEDINLITLLVSSTAAGLEVLAPDGTWLRVADDPGAIIVNCGDMLQLYTGGRLRSATHRVVNGKGGTPRYSIPLFLHPRPEVVLDKATGKTAGEYLTERLNAIGLFDKLESGDAAGASPKKK